MTHILPASSSNISALRYTADPAANIDPTMMSALRAGGMPRINSRLITPGDVFFALPGEITDGHRYAVSAAECGASAVVVSSRHITDKELESIANTSTIAIIVDDPLITLQQVARARRLESKATVIAITGSAGKTSVKEITKFLLGYTGKCHATEGNYNNLIGAPLTLAGLPGDADYAIIEAGMNNSGELDLLASIILPDIAVITTIQPAHAGNFSDISDIARAKAELLEGVLPSGVAILGADHSFLKILTDKAEQQHIHDVRTVGMNDGPFTAYIKDYLPENPASTVGYHMNGADYTFLCGLRGKHQAYCILLALTIADAAGVHINDIATHTQDIRPLKGRGEETHIRLTTSPDITRVIIDESYNASPEAVIASIISAKTHYEAQHVCIVLGDMLEMGKDTSHYYKAIAAYCKDCAGVVTIGDDSVECTRALEEDVPFLHHFHDSDSAAAALPAILPDSARVILVKGSRGIRTERVISALTNA